MIKKELTIINKLGLHARAATKLVTISQKYSSDIKIQRGEKTVDSKSIMAVMMLAAAQGTQVTFTIEGSDEERAIMDIENLINNRFDEAE